MANFKPENYFTCKSDFYQLWSFHINQSQLFLPTPDTGLSKSFNNLTEAINDSKDPLETTRHFFRNFLDCINSQNGTSITISEACCLLRQNMDLIPMECRESFNAAVDAIEFDHLSLTDAEERVALSACALYWPWKWNWFGLNKSHKNHHRQSKAVKTVEIFKLFAGCCAIAAITYVALCNPTAIKPATEAILLILEMVIH